VNATKEQDDLMQPTFIAEQIEVLVRVLFPESDGKFCVIVRDGASQIVTFYGGSNEKAIDHAKLLHSIIKAMYERTKIDSRK